MLTAQRSVALMSRRWEAEVEGSNEQRLTRGTPGGSRPCLSITRNNRNRFTTARNSVRRSPACVAVPSGATCNTSVTGSARFAPLALRSGDQHPPNAKHNTQHPTQGEVGM